MGEHDDVTNFEQSEYGSTVGLILAIISTIFIGSSFIVKKKALIKISNRGNVRASAGGYGYLTECVWWVGLLLMGIGELANFAAFAFAPATLVAPLGALSVLVSSILASKFLNEKLNILGKIGCVLCIIGSTVIIIHSPKKDKIQTMESIIENMEQLTFLSYLFIVAIIFLSIFFYFGPKYGHKNALVYILMCSAVGSLTVLACKGLGIAIQDSIRNEITDLINTFNFFLIITIIVCIVTQMNYLNKALDLFNTAIVTPVYYVLFTIFVVTSSTILYSEWENLNYDDVIGNVCGFLTVVAAIFLLNGFRDLDIGLNDVQTTVKNKQWDNGSAMRVCVKKQQTKKQDEEFLILESDNNKFNNEHNC
ncbi:Non-imprinted in PRader-Willi/Angelman syndrome region protein, putative [Pediculus humanus corporis]|uniref:Non-imprinted in PRader-Willi/Angelman syndrome region protein, putative n=1 Tax=Pediculus humanus subsp. corporis TaxID=121224 RepID=E0W2Q8_PEDHC|nr:Non-imprinted in PRader-Willi/Angelman syndrome region protein, putative [Pediculus humanus corporis]EEB19914.1 Non-imprinted in PRader-Willi/Angelman syndrome region protein, putative [Pediculus humanus corporis]